MSVSELKKQIHHNIDLIEDEDVLSILNDAAAAYVTEQPDIVDLLTPAQLDGLDDAIRQVERGNVVSHDVVTKMSREWLKISLK